MSEFIFKYFLSWDRIYPLSEKGTKIILTNGKTKEVSPVKINYNHLGEYCNKTVVLKNSLLQSHPSEGFHSSENGQMFNSHLFSNLTMKPSSLKLFKRMPTKVYTALISLCTKIILSLK